MKPRLVSYKLCPFVQRVAIVLHQKNIEHDIEYIDLAKPPEWFLELSPFKKVPILQIDGDVLWESSVINEYLDEVFPNKLHPADPFLRANNRSWIEQANQFTVSVFQLGTKEAEEDFQGVLADLLKNLDMIETAISGTPFFNGAEFSLVDAAYAPILQRLDFLDEIRPGILNGKRHPKVVAWKETLVAHPSIQKASVPKIRELYRKLLWKRHGYIAQFLDRKEQDPDVKKALY